MNKFIIFIFLIFNSFFCYSQKKVGTPVVFFIGDNESEYEKKMRKYDQMLFQACENDMNKAQEYWNNFLQELEDFANNQEVDLKGMKLWINVFWSKQGQVDYLYFYPKPNSRNYDYEKLKLLFTKFINQHQSAKDFKQQFSHYGSASFPLMPKLYKPAEK